MISQTSSDFTMPVSAAVPSSFFIIILYDVCKTSILSESSFQPNLKSFVFTIVGFLHNPPKNHITLAFLFSPLLHIAQSFIFDATLAF